MPKRFQTRGWSARAEKNHRTSGMYGLAVLAGGVQNRPSTHPTTLDTPGLKMRLLALWHDQRRSGPFLRNFGPHHGRRLVTPNLVVTYVLVRICRQTPVFDPYPFPPCISRPILSFRGIASHAETVSNEVLVSPGRQKSPEFSRWPDRRFWSFLAPQNRCRHGFCQRPGTVPKKIFRLFSRQNAIL